MSAINDYLKTGVAASESTRTAKLSFTQAENKLSARPVNAEETLTGKDGLSFGDIIDVVNPLQHIPGVSQVYRAVTGDQINAAAKIAGAALFGGPIGAVIAVADTVVQLATGDDAVGNVTTALSDDAAEQILSPNATLLTASDVPAAAVPTPAQIVAEAVETTADGAVRLPEDEEEERQAAVTGNAAGAFRLGIDTVAEASSHKSGKAAEELARAVKPEVKAGITLNPDVSDVAVKALGGASLQHQIYRQVQTADSLYTRALDMRG